MTACISGALIAYAFPDHPAWVPHRTVTHAEALNSIALHMKRDAIATGPIVNNGRISGNSFIASAGFCIEEPTADEVRYARSLWAEHVKSKHYQLAQAQMRLGNAMKDAEAAAAEGKTWCEREGAKSRARANWLPSIKAVETQMNGIYRATARAEGPTPVQQALFEALP
jgi:hypothetical protein